MDFVYSITIYPIELFYQYLYLLIYGHVGNLGVSLVILSSVNFILCLPLEGFVKKFQRQEAEIQSVLAPQIAVISAESHGSERQQRLHALYKRYSYHPIYALRSSCGLLVQVPLLMAAFYMLSGLDVLKGESFFIIKDLSVPDALLGGMNLLPIIMTLVNMASVFFYTQSSSRRDKVQLYGIAVFFLAILYNASSALVLYWTCSNVFSLIKNIVISRLSHSGTVRKSLFFSKSILGAIISSSPYFSYLLKCIKKFGYSFLVAALPCSIVLVAGGIDLYINNRNEFPFTFHELLPLLLHKAVIASILLALILLFMPIKHSIFSRCVALVVGISIGLFIEGTVLAQNYNVLDGHTTIEPFSEKAVLSLCVWGVALFLPQYFHKQITSLRIVFLGYLVFVSPLWNLNKFHEEINTPTDRQGELAFNIGNDFFDFSKDKNVIILSLDSFNGDIVEQIFNEPYYKEMFDGFYWLKDFSAIFPTTLPSIYTILGANPYDNTTPLQDYFINTHPQTLPYQLKQDGYVVRSVDAYGVPAAQSVYDNLGPRTITDFDIWALMQKVISFTFYPHNFKGLALKEEGKGWDFTKLKKFQSMEFSSNSIKPVFMYMHFVGGHIPWRVKEDFSVSKEATYLSQCKASLKMIRIFLDRLKNINVLKNSTIIITSDTSTKSLKMVDQHIIGLVKPFGTIENLLAVDAPLSNLEIKKIILDQLNNQEISLEYFKSIANNDRTVRFYNWDDGWNKKYLPVMTEYKISGVASNAASYLPTGRRYIPGKFSLPMNSSFTFPADYNKLKTIFSDSWQVTADGVEAQSENIIAGKPNMINISIEDDGLSKVAEVLFEYKNIGDGLNNPHSTSQLPVFRQQEFFLSPFDVALYAPKGRVLKKISIIPHEGGYPVDSVIDFSRPLGAMLSLGWSPPSMSFRWVPPFSYDTWSDAKTATIKLPVVPETRGLVIMGQAFTPNGRPQRIGISINGFPVWNKVVKMAPLFIKLYFPPEVLDDIAAGKILDIEFNLPDADAPKNLNVSADDQVRAVGLRKLKTFGKPLAIAVGSKVQFINNDDPANTLSSGWSAPEAWGVWSEAKKASLKLTVAPGTRGLRIIGQAFTPNGRPQRVDMSINGISVWTKVVTEVPLNIELKFPPEVLDEVAVGKDLNIRFNLPDAESPNNLDMSPDERLLAIGLKEIETFGAFVDIVTDSGAKLISNGDPVNIFSSSRSAAEVDSKIKFSSNDNSLRFLNVGWSAPEAWGVWSNAKNASLKLTVPPDSRGLLINGQAFVPNGRPQRVDITINSVSVWSSVLTDIPLNISLEFPPEVLDEVAAGKVLDIGFNLPDAESPKTFNINLDERLLAIGLMEIETFGKLGTIAVGSKIKFSTNEEKEHVLPRLSFGWSVPEAWGVWSDAKKASLKLIVAPDTRGLAIMGQAFTPNGRPQRVDVSINGISVWSKVLTEVPLNIKITFPSKVLDDVAAGNVLDIGFSLPDSESPKKLNVNLDERLLAIGLIEIETFGDISNNID